MPSKRSQEKEDRDAPVQPLPDPRLAVVMAGSVLDHDEARLATARETAAMNNAEFDAAAVSLGGSTANDATTSTVTGGGSSGGSGTSVGAASGSGTTIGGGTATST
jgi:hypothetical protein